VNPVPGNEADRLHVDPDWQQGHKREVRLQAWTGQRSAALRQYRELVRILDRELAVRPLPETTRIYDDVRAGRLGPVSVPIPAPARSAARQAMRTDPMAADAPWPLVGRAAELRALNAAWHAVGRDGRGGQGIGVVGQAGSGKTRLMEEFRASIDADGGTVISGRCHDGESGLPFALTADLLRSAGSVCPDLPDRLPEGVAAAVGRLSPELAAAHPDVPAPALSARWP